MILSTIKTKQAVIYDPIIQKSGIVFLDITEVKINGNGYTSRSVYYVVENEKRIDLKIEFKSFTRAQAVQLFNALSVVGNNFDEQIFNLIPKVAMYRLGISGDFGLTSNDWEIV